MASPIIKKIGGAAASLLILFGLFLCAAYIYYALVEVHLSHYSIRLARNDPAALFFKDVDNPRLRTDIIDRSNSLDSLFALGGSNLDLYQLNKVAPRLIVFVDNTSADAFLTTTTDILRRADHNTSLLAINLATKEVSLNLSETANATFTDQEAHQLIESTLTPAVEQLHVEYAILMAIDTYRYKTVGDDLHLARTLLSDDIKEASTITTKIGQQDYTSLFEEQAYKAIAHYTAGLFIAIGFAICLAGLGIYRMLRTPNKWFGVAFGALTGYYVYIIHASLTFFQNSVSDLHPETTPAIIAVAIGGIVGFFIDYLISVPRQKKQP